MNKCKVGYIVNYEGGSQFFREWHDVLELFNSQKDMPPMGSIEIKNCVYISEPGNTGERGMIGWRV